MRLLTLATLAVAPFALGGCGVTTDPMESGCPGYDLPPFNPAA